MLCQPGAAASVPAAPLHDGAFRRDGRLLQGSPLGERQKPTPKDRADPALPNPPDMPICTATSRGYRS